MGRETWRTRSAETGLPQTTCSTRVSYMVQSSAARLRQELHGKQRQQVHPTE